MSLLLTFKINNIPIVTTYYAVLIRNAEDNGDDSLCELGIYSKNKFVTRIKKQLEYCESGALGTYMYHVAGMFNLNHYSSYCRCEIRIA